MSNSKQQDSASKPGGPLWSDHLEAWVSVLTASLGIKDGNVPKQFLSFFPIRICAVVDANVINKELRWRLGSRRNPLARSSLQEAIDSGVFVPIAPTYLNEELADDLLEISVDTGRTLWETTTEWLSLRMKLRFYQPAPRLRDLPEVDPDDVQYKYASEDLGVPVYTEDRHLERMGAAVLWADEDLGVDLALRDHARARTVTVAGDLTI
ncbi:MAG: hypothetical protein ABSD20_14570, partial [Terriglobales bacterium]